MTAPLDRAGTEPNAEACEWPSTEYVKSVCRIGQGAMCCRYLTMGSGGWSCEKKTSLKSILDARVMSMTARGDNCEGRP